MIIKNIPCMIIFEDDVYFHPNWKQLFPKLYEETPKNFDFLYLGSSYSLFTTTKVVEKGPVYQTHAMVLTLFGAKKLVEYVETRPIKTLDVMLSELGRNEAGKDKINWYIWDITHLSEEERGEFDPNFNGLVYQQTSFPSNCSG